MQNDYAREEMDAYGGHLPVVIESADGNLFHVEEVTSVNRGGEVLVALVIGEKYEG